MNKLNGRLLLVTAFTGTVSGGLFWTGFPLAFSCVWKSFGSLSSVYSLAVAGSVLFDLLGGLFSTARLARVIAISSLFASSIILSLICVAIYFSAPIAILALLPPMYFNFSLGSIAENVWLLECSEPESFRKSYLDRGTVVIAAKLAGFSMGPVLFHEMGLWGVLPCFLLSLITAAIQTRIPGNSKEAVVPQPIDASSKVRKLLSLSKRPLFIIPFLLAGLLSVPMNLLFVAQILNLGDSRHAGLFWLLAGIASLSAMRFLRANKLPRSRPTLLLFFAISVVSCLSLKYIPIVEAILVCGALYVFASVFLSGSLQVKAVADLARGDLGIGIGYMNFLVDAGVLLGLLITSKIEVSSQHQRWPLEFILPLIFVVALRFALQFLIVEKQPVS